jgi:hypothetical protein
MSFYSSVKTMLRLAGVLGMRCNAANFALPG